MNIAEGGIKKKIAESYFSVEDRWYHLLDYLQDKGIPVYKVVDPLEDAGIPSFPLFTGLLILAIVLIYMLLGGGVPGITPPGMATLDICVYDDASQEAVAGASVNLLLDGREQILITDSTGCVSLEVTRGAQGSIYATAEGYGDSTEIPVMITASYNSKQLLMSRILETPDFEMSLHFTYDYDQYPPFNVSVKFYDAFDRLINTTVLEVSGDSSKFSLLVPKRNQALARRFDVWPSAYFKEATRNIVSDVVIIQFEPLRPPESKLSATVLDEDRGPVTNCVFKLFDEKNMEVGTVSCGNGGNVETLLEKGVSFYAVVSADGFVDKLLKQPNGTLFVMDSYPLDLGEIILDRADINVTVVVRDAANFSLLEDVYGYFYTPDRTLLDKVNFDNSYTKGIGLDDEYKMVVFRQDYLREIVDINAQNLLVDVGLERATPTNSGFVEVCVKYAQTGENVSFAQIFLKDDLGYYMAPPQIANVFGCYMYRNISVERAYAEAFFNGKKGTSRTLRVEPGSIIHLEVLIASVNYTFTVEVQGPDGLPVEGAQVELLEPGGNPILGARRTDSDGKVFYVVKEGERLRAVATYTKDGLTMRAESGLVTMFKDETVTLQLSNKSKFGIDFLGISDVRGNPLQTSHKLSVGEPYILNFQITMNTSVNLFRAFAMVGDQPSLMNDDVYIEIGTPLSRDKCDFSTALVGIDYDPESPLITQPRDIPAAVANLVGFALAAKFTVYEWDAQAIPSNTVTTIPFCFLVRPMRSVNIEKPLHIYYKAWFNATGFERWVPLSVLPEDGWIFAENYHNTDYVIFPGTFICDGPVCWQLAYKPEDVGLEEVWNVEGTIYNLTELGVPEGPGVTDFSYPVNPSNSKDYFLVGKNETLDLLFTAFYEGTGKFEEGEALISTEILGKHSTIQGYRLASPVQDSQDRIKAYEIPVLINPVGSGITISAVANSNASGIFTYMAGPNKTSYASSYINYYRFGEEATPLSRHTLKFNIMGEIPYGSVRVIEDGETAQGCVAGFESVYAGVMFSGRKYDLEVKVHDRFNNPIENAIVEIRDPQGVARGIASSATTLIGNGEKCGKNGTYVYSECTGGLIQISPSGSGNLLVTIGGDSADLERRLLGTILVINDAITIRDEDGKRIGTNDVVDVTLQPGKKSSVTLSFENEGYGSLSLYFNNPEPQVSENLGLSLAYESNPITLASPMKVTLSGRLLHELNPRWIENESGEVVLNFTYMDTTTRSVAPCSFSGTLRVRLSYVPPGPEFDCNSDLICTKFLLSVGGKVFNMSRFKDVVGEYDSKFYIQKGEFIRVDFETIYLRDDDLTPTDVAIAFEPGYGIIIENASVNPTPRRIGDEPGEAIERMNPDLVEAESLSIGMPNSLVSLKSTETSTITGTVYIHANSTTLSRGQLFGVRIKYGQTSFDPNSFPYVVVPVLGNLSIYQEGELMNLSKGEHLATFVIGRAYDIAVAMMDREGQTISEGSIMLETPDSNITCTPASNNANCTGLRIKNFIPVEEGVLKIRLNNPDVGEIYAPPIEVISRKLEVIFMRCANSELAEFSSNCESVYSGFDTEKEDIQFYMDSADMDLVQILAIKNTLDVDYDVIIDQSVSDGNKFVVTPSQRNISLGPNETISFKLLAAPYISSTTSLPIGEDKGELALTFHGRDALGAWKPISKDIGYHINVKTTGSVKRSDDGKAMTYIRLRDHRDNILPVSPTMTVPIQENKVYKIDYRVFYIMDQVRNADQLAVSFTAQGTPTVTFLEHHTPFSGFDDLVSIFTYGCTGGIQSIRCALGNNAHSMSGKISGTDYSSFVYGTLTFNASMEGLLSFSMQFSDEV